ncbi:MAG: hypothetical protein HEQ32_00285 [Vampirovibrio sp.]
MAYQYEDSEKNLEKLQALKQSIEESIRDNTETLSPESVSILKQMLEILEVGLTRPYIETLVCNLCSGVRTEGESYFHSSYWNQDNIIRGVGFRILAYWKTLPELYKRKSPILDLNKRHEELNKLTIEATTALDEVKRLEKQIAEIYASSNSKGQIISGYEEKVVAQQNNQLLDTIQTIHAEVKAKNETITETLNTLKASSKRYTDQLSVLKARINTFEDTDKNYKSAKNTLEELQAQTRAELGKAVDINIFTEFDAVKAQKDKSANKWFRGAFVTILVIFAGAICITVTHQTAIPQVKTLLDLLSFIAYKFSILFPLIGLAVFCIQRFLKESRLAEEYRFKSTCALHFRSYMELVQEICTKEVDKEYREFLIAQIQQLFISPTERMYKDSNPNNFKAFQDTLGLIFPQVDKLKQIMTIASKEEGGANQ